MKTKILSLLTVLLSLLIPVGCATYKAPKAHTFDNSRAYFMDYDKVWSRIIGWFSIHTAPTKILDKSSGFIVSEEGTTVPGPHPNCDCGEVSGGWKIVNGRFSFNIHVFTQDDNSIKVVVKTRCSAVAGYYGQPSIICYSTGLYEKRLLDYIGDGEDVPNDGSGT